MAPTWAALAQNLESVENVKIIKLDCTAHRANCEKYEIQGFPTLVLFKDNEKVDFSLSLNDDINEANEG